MYLISRISSSLWWIAPLNCCVKTYIVTITTNTLNVNYTKTNWSDFLTWTFSSHCVLGVNKGSPIWTMHPPRSIHCSVHHRTQRCLSRSGHRSLRPHIICLPTDTPPPHLEGRSGKTPWSMCLFLGRTCKCSTDHRGCSLMKHKSILNQHKAWSNMRGNCFIDFYYYLIVLLWKPWKLRTMIIPKIKSIEGLAHRAPIIE